MAADPYLQENGTFKNRLGITDAAELQARETAISSVRLAQMQQLERPVGRFDLDHLREIHRRAFGDVYEWAGKTRGEWTTIEGERFMPPAGLMKGGTRFADGPMVEPFLRSTFRQLERDDQLRGLSRPEFAGKAAELMGDMNAAHPFREGNGRTQREFMRELGVEAGHQLNFSVVSQARMVQVSIESARGNNEGLRRMLLEISDRQAVRALQHAEQALEKRGQDWNGLYVATTTRGQQYAGEVAWKGRELSAVQDGNRVIVALTRELGRGVQEGQSVQFTASGRVQGMDLER